MTPRVDRFSQVTVRTNRYAVPVRLVGRQVRVQLHASDLVIDDGRNPVARHERLMAKSRSRLDLDHYLETGRCYASSGHQFHCGRLVARPLLKASATALAASWCRLLVTL
ncbi:hypothetical protein [Actinoplanes sp. M2I2]|uniref:Mu transposase domain-containing protein n=1 Tax=Actinoplanes sp. M2I2 TaxID=1734444 RepID=UPI0035AF77E4